MGRACILIAVFIMSLLVSFNVLAKATINTIVTIDGEELDDFNFYYPQWDELNGKDGVFRYTFRLDEHGELDSFKQLEGGYHYVVQKQVRYYLTELKLEEYSKQTGIIKINYRATENEVVKKVIDNHRRFYTSEKYEQAEKELLRAISIEPQNPVLHYFLGETYWRQKRVEDSFETYRKVISLAPHNSLPYYSLAYRYYTLDRGEEAKKYLGQSIGLHDAWENHWLGFKIYEKEENVVEALSHLALALELIEDKARIYKDRGWYLLELESYELALDDFESGLEYKPDDDNLLHGATNSAIEINNYRLAKRYVKRALKNNPNDIDTLFWTASAYDNMGEDRLSVNNLKKVIAMDETYDAALNNLGFSYTKLWDFEKAIEVLKRGIELNLDSEYLLNNLGVAYFHNGNYRKAIDVLNQKIAEDEKEGNAAAFSKGYLAWSFIRLGRDKEALPLIKEILHDEPDYYDGLHQDLYGEGNYLPSILEEFVTSSEADNYEGDMGQYLKKIQMFIQDKRGRSQ